MKSPTYKNVRKTTRVKVRRRERVKSGRIRKGNDSGKGLRYRGILTLHPLNLHGAVQKGALVIFLSRIFARGRAHTHTHTHTVHARTTLYVVIWLGVFGLIELHQSVRLSVNALRNNRFYWYMRGFWPLPRCLLTSSTFWMLWGEDKQFCYPSFGTTCRSHLQGSRYTKTNGHLNPRKSHRYAVPKRLYKWHIDAAQRLRRLKNSVVWAHSNTTRKTAKFHWY